MSRKVKVRSLTDRWAAKNRSETDGQCFLNQWPGNSGLDNRNENMNNGIKEFITEAAFK